MLCDRLGGWDGEGGREGDAGGRRYGNVCISVADSLCCKAETNKKNNNNNMSVAMSKPSTCILISKYYFPFKGSRTPWGSKV